MSAGYIVGGPKSVTLLTLDGVPVLLLGEQHHGRSDNPTVVHMIRQLMECNSNAQILFEGKKLTSKRKEAKRDSVSEQVVRTASSYKGRAWPVDLKNLDSEFNKSIFDSAKADTTVAPDIEAYRRRLVRVFTDVYEKGVYDDQEVDALFDRVPNTKEYFDTCKRKLRNLADRQGNRQKGHMKPALDVFVSKGSLPERVPDDGDDGDDDVSGSNTLNEHTKAGARALMVSLFNDMYACEIIATQIKESKAPAIFYGGDTHCDHIFHILSHCYPFKEKKLLFTSTEAIDIHAKRARVKRGEETGEETDKHAVRMYTAVAINNDQKDLLLARFCAANLGGTT